MTLRKVLISILVIAMAALPLAAMTLDEMIEKAMQNSATIRSLEISRENTMISRQMDDVGQTVSVSLSTGNMTVRKERSGLTVFSVNPSVEVTLPEFSDKSTLTFNVSSSSSFDENGNTSLTVTPEAAYKKTINLDSFTDTRDDIAKRMNVLRQDMSYKKSLLQFRNTFMQSVSTILQSQSSLKSQEVTYSRLVNDYEESLEAGDITKDSLKDLQTRMSIDNRRVSIENAEKRLQDQLKSFHDSYGFDFVQPDSIREASLDLIVDEYGNTNVLLSEMSLESARQAVEVAAGTANKLQLGANADVPVTTDNWESPTMTANASVSGTLAGANYSLGARAGANYANEDLYPYITITGTWKNKTTAKTDELTLQTLKNQLVLAEMDYEDTVASYKSEITSLRDSINNLSTEVSMFEVSAQYNRMILERTLDMYDRGLATDREVEDARLTVESDEIQAMVYKINALVIENNIAMSQL